MRISVFTALIFLLACSDDGSERLEVRGTVLSFDTKQPQPGQNVVIELGSQIDLFTHNFINPSKDSITTDSNGEFRFDVKVGRWPYYKIKLASPGYVRANEKPMIDGVPIVADGVEEKLVFDTLLIGKSAGVRLMVRNDHPRDGDIIHVRIPFNSPYATPRFSPVISYSYDDRMGMIPANTFQFLSALNAEVKIYIQILRGEETLDTSRVVSLQDQQVVDVLIDY